MAAGNVGRPSKFGISRKGLIRRRSIVRQHAQKPGAEGDEICFTGANRIASENGSRGLGKDAGAGLVCQGQDPSFCQHYVHQDPIAASRIMRLTVMIGLSQPACTVGICGKAQEATLVKWIAHPRALKVASASGVSISVSGASLPASTSAISSG